jgi:hypothetical protein
MERTAAARGIETVMLYDEWFEHLPESWRRVGRLRLSRPRITPAWERVSFYATSDAVYPAVRDRVRAFAATLPDRVEFEFAQ